MMEKGGVKSMANIELTERDILLLRYLADYGILSVKAAGNLYQTNSYHENRIAVLSNAGYVIRNNGIRLARKGRDYLKERNLPMRNVPKQKSHQERTAIISEIGTAFHYSDIDFISSWRAKEMYNINSNSKLFGILQNDMLTAIYGISSETKSTTIKKIKEEIQKIQALGIGRAVILASSKEAMDKYGVEAQGIGEQLLLPYSDYSIKLLKQHDNLCYKSAKSVMSEIQPSQWPLADYSDAAGHPVIVLVLNDLEKRAKLQSYYHMTEYRHTSTQQINIICLKSQESLFAKEYPQARIIPISETVLVK